MSAQKKWGSRSPCPPFLPHPTSLSPPGLRCSPSASSSPNIGLNVCMSISACLSLLLSLTLYSCLSHTYYASWFEKTSGSTWNSPHLSQSFTNSKQHFVLSLGVDPRQALQGPRTFQNGRLSSCRLRGNRNHTGPRKLRR